MELDPVACIWPVPLDGSCDDSLHQDWFELHLLSHGRTGDGEERIDTKNVILATGSKPRALPGLETDGRVVLDSDQILDLERLPGSMIVLGSGAVGVEFASCYADYGVAVTLVELLPSIVPLEDKDVSAGLARSFGKRGINILTDVRALPETLERITLKG